MPSKKQVIERVEELLYKVRFNVTGAQWRRKNTPSMLALRVTQANHDWDECWNQLQAA